MTTTNLEALISDNNTLLHTIDLLPSSVFVERIQAGLQFVSDKFDNKQPVIDSMDSPSNGIFRSDKYDIVDCSITGSSIVLCGLHKHIVVLGTDVNRYGYLLTAVDFLPAGNTFRRALAVTKKWSYDLNTIKNHERGHYNAAVERGFQAYFKILISSDNTGEIELRPAVGFYPQDHSMTPETYYEHRRMIALAGAGKLSNSDKIDGKIE